MGGIPPLPTASSNTDVVGREIFVCNLEQENKKRVQELKSLAVCKRTVVSNGTAMCSHTDAQFCRHSSSIELKE